MCREVAAAYLRYRLVPLCRAPRAKMPRRSEHTVVVENDVTVGGEPPVGFQSARAAGQRFAKRAECVVRPVPTPATMGEEISERRRHVGSR